MIPPFKVSKSGVHRLPTGANEKALLQNHLTKMTNKITKNTISINFENNENNEKSGPIMFNNYLNISSQCYIHCS